MSRESKQQPTKAEKATKSDRSAKGPARKRGATGAVRSGTKDSGMGRTGKVRPMLTSRAAILALVVCAIALSLAYPLREYIMQRSQISELQDESARMEENVAYLEERQEVLREDEYVEREARSRLHYQYPDETAYIVIRPDTESEADADPEKPAEPWFAQLWRSVEEADSPQVDDGL
ncbi:hypothetical protein GCM10027590_52770 [Nocardiopsis nanhaiensis]